MKLLFVISKYYPKIGGTPNCTRNLVNFLKADHSVEVLTTKDRVDDKEATTCEGVRVHKVLSLAHIAMRGLLHDKSIPLLRRLGAVTGKLFFKLFPVESAVLRRRFKKRLIKLQQKEGYDWVVAVGGDIVPARAVSGCKDLKRRCFYQLDPYTTNTTLPEKGKEKRAAFEKKLHESFDLVLTTEMIKKEMTGFFPMGKNVVSCNFPNITDRTGGEGNTTGQIRCLFCGAMYAARNMDFALEVMDAISKANPEIFFDFYVLGDTSAVKAASEKNSNIRLFAPVSPTEIFGIMQSHDVLINIGNVMTNQVPSKIYDYISTGRPILNFLCNKDCPTVDVLRNYPLSLSLHSSVPVNEAAEEVSAFIKANAHKRESYSHVETHYYENTINCVANIMVCSMEDIGEK